MLVFSAVFILVLGLAVGGFFITRSLLSAVRELANRINQIESSVNNVLNTSIGILNSNLTAQIGNLNNYVNSLTLPVKGMASDMEELSRLMLHTKNRGEAGETLLGTLLGDFLSNDQFKINLKIDEGGTVEFAVKVSSASGPNDKMEYYIPIDSKIPADRYKDYIAARESGDAQKVKSEFNRFITALKNQASEVAKYTNKKSGDSQTLDLGILYFPFESIYSVVTSDFSDVVADIRRQHNIFICGPNNLASIIASIKVCNRLYLQNINSDQIQGVLLNFHGEIVSLTEEINGTERNLKAGLNHVKELKTRINAVQGSLSDLTQE
ncbi:MAG: DNA recombination protein RmuC [Holophagaceae bacterium]|jgi:DNA anti-recombination protein RmuC